MPVRKSEKSKTTTGKSKTMTTQKSKTTSSKTTTGTSNTSDSDAEKPKPPPKKIPINKKWDENYVVTRKKEYTLDEIEKSYKGRTLPNEIRSKLRIPSSYNFEIYSCEMNVDMLNIATQVALACIEDNFTHCDTAQELKECFDAACPPGPWQSVVGDGYYAIATHIPGYYAYFGMKEIKVLVYRSTK